MTLGHVALFNLALASMPLFKLRIEAAEAEAGRSAAGLLRELSSPEPIAVTLFEAQPPRFTVEAYYAGRPPLALLEPMLKGVAGLDAPALEDVPDLNWLALSQAALPPVEAGPAAGARQPRSRPLRAQAYSH
jgi:ribosomal protein L11 methyltransferase